MSCYIWDWALGPRFMKLAQIRCRVHEPHALTGSCSPGSARMHRASLRAQPSPLRAHPFSLAGALPPFYPLAQKCRESVCHANGEKTA